MHAKLGDINWHSHIHPTCSLWIKFPATSLLASRSKNYHKFVPILQGDLTYTSNFLIKMLKMGRKFCKYGWSISNGDMVITGDIIQGMWWKPEKANYIFEETTVTFTSYCKIWSHLKDSMLIVQSCIKSTYSSLPAFWKSCIHTKETLSVSGNCKNVYYISHLIKASKLNWKAAFVLYLLMLLLSFTARCQTAKTDLMVLS